MRLRPLDQKRTIEKAYELFPNIAAEVAEIVARASSGHLLALENMVDLLNSQQLTGSAPLMPPMRANQVIHDLATEYLRDFADDALEMLKFLALAPCTSIEFMVRMFPRLWGELEALESADVVLRSGPNLSISNGIVRASVYRSMSVRERSDLHAQMAEAGEPEEPIMALWHSTFVSPVEGASDALLSHARWLVTQGRSDAALEFTERALMLGHDESRTAPLLLDLADELIFRGLFVSARRYIRFARRSSGHASIALRAARLSVELDFLSSRAITTGRAYTGPQRQESDALAERIRLKLARSTCHAQRWELAQAEAELAAARALAERTDSATTISFAAAAIIVDGYRGRSDAALEKYHSTLEAGLGQDGLLESISVLVNLILTEHYDQARSLIDMLEDAAPSPSIIHELAWLYRAELEIRMGNTYRVGQILDETRRVSTRSRIRPDLELLLRCWYLLQQGQTVAVEEFEQQLVRVAGQSGTPSVMARLSMVQGSFFLRRGLPAEALRHLHRCEELDGADSNPNVLRHEPELIEALVAVGRREHASFALQRFRKRLDRYPSRWGELAALRCDALLATGERSLELFRRALRTWRSSDSDYEKARTTAAYAGRLGELGMTADSREQSLLAVSLYRENGDDIVADALTPQQTVERRPTLDHPLLQQLSGDERAIVDLVRQGYRNRDIAEKLYVSLRTVEIRLTSVYRKFNVRSRTRLIATLAQFTFSAEA